MFPVLLPVSGFFGAWPIRAADELKLGMVLSKSNKNFVKNNEIQ
jgi:hypothetical protein